MAGIILPASPKHMPRLLTLVDRLSRFTESVAVLLIFGYCALMLAEVLARAQARSLSFTWEYSQYAMAAIFALASGPAIRSGVHVRISLLSDHLPARAARYLDVLATLAALCVVTLIVWAMWVKVGKSIDRNIVATSITKTPLWIPQSLVLWGFAQLWLDCLARAWRRWAGLPYEWSDSDAEINDV
ncbi:MAG: TRAP-type C4-dicarboxylate transport system permease small subunit [Granulosicoccus sp.]